MMRKDCKACQKMNILKSNYASLNQASAGGEQHLSDSTLRKAAIVYALLPFWSCFARTCPSGNTNDNSIYVDFNPQALTSPGCLAKGF